MNYTPIQRIAARLPEAPFYVNDMEYPVIVSNIWEALKKYKMYSTTRHFVTRDVVNYEVDLGCVNQIHNVVLYEDVVTTNTETITHPNQVVFVADPDNSTQLNEEIEIEDIKRLVPHIIGQYVDFKENGNCLEFKDDGIKVGIEYTTLKVDKIEGYPLVPEDAEMMVAWYCACQQWRGEYMAGRLDGGRLQYAEAMLKEAVHDATSIIRVSQNDMDKIGNILTSFDRKTYGFTS